MNKVSVVQCSLLVWKAQLDTFHDGRCSLLQKRLLGEMILLTAVTGMVQLEKMIYCTWIQSAT